MFKMSISKNIRISVVNLNFVAGFDSCDVYMLSEVHFTVTILPFKKAA